MRCPHGCQGKCCELVEIGPAMLSQSGNTHLPARRYAKEDCPVQLVATMPTGERWKATP